MRGSTAARINNSLLLRDCSCGEFACSAVWGRDLFPGIFGEFADGAVLGRGLFFLVFVGFPVVLSGEETFSLAFVAFGICGICGIWHFWHSAHSVPEKASCGTEYARCAQNSLLWYAAHFRKPSVLKTGFYGTEQAFGARKPPPVVRGTFSCFTINEHKMDI